MTLIEFSDPAYRLSSPPSGSVNVKVGKSIAGKGGEWFPCATRTGRTYFASLFQVGPGKRQVCAVGMPLASEEAALSKAIELAVAAAA